MGRQGDGCERGAHGRQAQPLASCRTMGDRLIWETGVSRQGGRWLSPPLVHPMTGGIGRNGGCTGFIRAFLTRSRSNPVPEVGLPTGPLPAKMGTLIDTDCEREADVTGSSQPKTVAIIMGSRSDWEVMKGAADILNALQVPHEVAIVSAHRTPDRLFTFAEQAESRGIGVIIAGAGGAAHLPGMTAAKTLVPVIGVPVPSRHLQGLDSLLSIVQMPGGVPVATMAIGSAGATNAGLFAAAVLAQQDENLRQRLQAWRQQQHDKVLAGQAALDDERGMDR